MMRRIILMTLMVVQILAERSNIVENYSEIYKLKYGFQNFGKLKPVYPTDNNIDLDRPLTFSVAPGTVTLPPRSVNSVPALPSRPPTELVPKVTAAPQVITTIALGSIMRQQQLAMQQANNIDPSSGSVVGSVLGQGVGASQSAGVPGIATANRGTSVGAQNGQLGIGNNRNVNVLGGINAINGRQTSIGGPDGSVMNNRSRGVGLGKLGFIGTQRQKGVQHIPFIGGFSSALGRKKR